MTPRTHAENGGQVLEIALAFVAGSGLTYGLMELKFRRYVEARRAERPIVKQVYHSSAETQRKNWETGMSATASLKGRHAG